MPEQQILMFVAHPDDEAFFGFSDILNNKCTVICFTNKNNPIRSKEFQTAIKFTNNKGFMMNCKDDATNSWDDMTNEFFFKKLKTIFETKYDAIVSHDSKGEYGHRHHKRVHSIATYFSEKLKIPFFDFRQRFDPANYGDKHDLLLSIYKSQKDLLSRFKYFFDR